MSCAQERLDFSPSAPLPQAISPLLEIGAYETLWAQDKMTVKRLADLFRQNPGCRPSDLVDHGKAMEMADRVLQVLLEKGVTEFGVRVNRSREYPLKLRDARNPSELLYYRGMWNWIEKKSVAVVGTRKPSEVGLRRARKVAQNLVQDGFAVVSGLAQGIDTAAHNAALEAGGVTIAVLGTPICEAYPRQNQELQEQIAERFLVVSQVPVWRYYQRNYISNRAFFPERNITMSAIAEATVIVEAGETSGTLYQARAALAQNRKLFILDSCFSRGLQWPERYLDRGAIRVRSYSDITEALGSGASHED